MTNGDVKKYRYTREDFEPLVTKPLHFNMLFDMKEDQVKVTLDTTYKYCGEEPLISLKLNSKALEVLSVGRYSTMKPLGGEKDFVAHVESFADLEEQTYQVDVINHFLIVRLAVPVEKNAEFVIRTVTVAKPTENILEGLYYDYTPEGCPKTIITQCQQYGFQRIVPCIDTMDAKAFYTTTIVADKRYTNMITNGDLAPGFHDEEGIPKHADAASVLGENDASRHVLKYYNHKVCMAPYLFFLGVGTYETYRMLLEFPDGDTTLLELLTYGGRATAEDAKRSLQMLHDSIIWVMVSLGPETCEHHDERKRIYELIEEREQLKGKQSPLILANHEMVDIKTLSEEDAARLNTIRDELKSLLSVWGKTGYKYTGAVYREIAMENSYYGGMENVGNTTIVSSCLCPSCTMDDGSYEYMERVKVHEYYHNINGSQVTGQSPFEIWLNEAVTVHMERKRYGFLFGQDYARLSEVQYMFRPALGPLAQDKSATSLSVEPEGFNQTQELVSVVTYSKAPEFVRMVELLLGYDKFSRALDMYHTKYSYANATTMEWIECMETSSGIDLQNLAKTWLKRPGYPEVTYSTNYDSTSRKYTVFMKQTGFEDKPENNNGPWDIPVDWALVKDGAVIKEGVYRFSAATATLEIEDVDEPDFLSFARSWSFFGTSKNTNISTTELTKQARTDPDAVNRYFAYRALADAEKARIIESLRSGQEYSVSDEYVKLHQLILFDETISPSTRSLTLREGNCIDSREDLSHFYVEVNKARKALLQAVWNSSGEKILEMYHKLQQQSVDGPHKDQLSERQLKAHLLSLVFFGTMEPILGSASKSGVEANAMDMAVDLLKNSPFMTDKIHGLSRVLEGPDSIERTNIQDEVFKEWSVVADKLNKYITVIGGLDSPDVATQIRQLMSSSCFNVNLSHHSRAITRGLSQIRHFSILTDEGLELMQEVFTKIGKVNQMSAYPILKAFDQVDKFDEETQAKLKKTLQAMQDSISAKSEESLYNQLNIMLKKT